MSGSGHGVAGVCVLACPPPRRLLVERSALESSVSRSTMPVQRTAGCVQRPGARQVQRDPVGPRAQGRLLTRGSVHPGRSLAPLQ